MAPDEFDQAIATNFLNLRERIVGSQSFRYAGFVLVAVELHLQHIPLHFLLLKFMARLKPIEIRLFRTLLLLYFFALQEPTTHTLVHDSQPENAGRFEFIFLLVFSLLLFAHQQRFEELHIVHITL